MNDFSHDELASAYLDGETTADERARVEGDPGLLARVERLRSARDALADAPVEAPDPAARDAAIRAAIAAAGASVAEARAPVVDLASARVRRRWQLISIAAVVLVVVGLAGVFIRLASDSSSSTKASTAAASSLPTTTAASQAERAGADSAAGGATGPSIAPLGSFSDQASLVEAARAAIGERDAAKQASPGGATTAPFATANDEAAPSASCSSSFRTAGATLLLESTALLEGRFVLVEVFALNDGTTQLVVTDPATCTEVFSQPL